MLNKKLKPGVFSSLGKPKNVFRGFSREKGLSNRIGKAGVSKQAEMALKGRGLRLGICYVVTPDSRAGTDRSPQGVFVSSFLHYFAIRIHCLYCQLFRCYPHRGRRVYVKAHLLSRECPSRISCASHRNVLATCGATWQHSMKRCSRNAAIITWNSFRLLARSDDAHASSKPGSELACHTKCDRRKIGIVVGVLFPQFFKIHIKRSISNMIVGR